MQLISIIDLTKALDALFERIKKEMPGDWLRDLSLIRRAYDHLKTLPQESESVLSSKVFNHDREIDKTTHEIVLACKQDESPSLKEPELPQENKPWTGDLTLINLFKIELENQVAILSTGIISLEQTDPSKETIDSMLRAAHSIKGAAQVVDLSAISQLAHVIEDVLVSIKNGQMTLNGSRIDIFLKAVDFLEDLSRLPPLTIYAWILHKKNELEDIKNQLLALSSVSDENESHQKTAPKAAYQQVKGTTELTPQQSEENDFKQDRVLRVTAQNLNQLMGLAGESMVESRWLHPFSQSLMRLKKISTNLFFTPIF